MYRKPSDDPLVAKARETQGWSVRDAPQGSFVMVEASHEGRIYKARSEKWGELVSMSPSCPGGCKRGSWDAEDGHVTCSRCHRTFDPEYDEQKCDSCRADVTGKGTWWPTSKDGEFIICDKCAGFTQEAIKNA